jgi:menaquinone-9 beta-reductase
MQDANGSYDAIVVGAGPGGATAAAFMASAGRKVLLVDKEAFPRDKICGDAISGKSVDVLKRLDLTSEVMAAEQVGSWGVTFGGPDGHEAAIPFVKDFSRPVPPGFVCAREVFDEIIVRKAVREGADLRENTTVEDLLFAEDGRISGAVLKGDSGRVEIRSPLVIGADGAYSVVARKLGMAQLDEKHYCAGLRVYYEGVSDFHERNHVELHFLSEAIPGYFWVFPMANGRANVGVGMLSAAVKKRKIKLKEVLEACIDHPKFRERFKDARPLGPVKGWGLPMGSQPRTMAGDGWMLVGDAASLIDPFTGEGIGNAMISGEKAAEWANRAHNAGDFSAAFLESYGDDVMRYLGGELRISHRLQQLINVQWLLSFVIRRAATSPGVAEAISVMFDDEGERKKLLRPSFYLKMLRG